MTVWHSDSLQGDVRDWLWQDMADTRDCFLCGNPLSFPMIMWAGTTSNIYLHGDCATCFVLKLSRDCWELERAKGRTHETG